MTQQRQRLKRYFDNMTPTDAARLFLIGGVLVYVVGYLADHVLHWDLPFIAEGYSNAGIELLSIAATVIVIDGLNERRAERRAEQQLREQLMRNASSTSNEIARDSLHQLDKHRWLRGSAGILQAQDFWNANLHDSDLREALLTRARFIAANLQGANLARADLQEARFTTADLTGAILTDVLAQSADFEAAQLAGARLIIGDFRMAKFSSAYLNEADFTSANLQGAMFYHSHLEGAIFTQANVQDARFLHVHVDETTILPDGSHWTPGTSLARFTEPDHPDFWRSDDPASPAYRDASP